jgi:hypothetical protein
VTWVAAGSVAVAAGPLLVPFAIIAVAVAAGIVLGLTALGAGPAPVTPPSPAGSTRAAGADPAAAF